MPLRLRRGTNADRITIVPVEGELIYTTDTKKIFVGDGISQGGVDVTGSSTVGGPVSQDLNLNHHNLTGIGNIEINGIISNGPLSLNQNYITSSSGYVSPGLGHQIGILELSTPNNLLQINRYWLDPSESIEIQTGITNSFSSLITDKKSSRGSISAPTATIPGDNISLQRFWGHDGFSYTPSSSIWNGVDPNGTVSPGNVPGAIAFITDGIGGPHITSIDSKGNLGIGVYPEPVQERLHVVGNALFTGDVFAASFKGSLFSDNSTVLVDSISGNITANNLSVSGTLNCGTTIQKSPIGYVDISSRYGITSGITSLMTGNYASRGSLTHPTSLFTGDSISFIRNYGHDGSNFVFSSGIGFSLDPSYTPSTGNMPGAIGFIVEGSDGQQITSINSKGQLGIRTFPSPTREALDVNGNGIFNGSITSNSLVTGTIRQNITTTGNVNSTSRYGLTDGLNSLIVSNYASRGTLTAPSTLYIGDSITTQRNYGFDGTNYILSSAISCVVDPTQTPTTGFVPGSIAFVVQGLSGQNLTSINSKGYLGINTFPNPTQQMLEVNGNALIHGDSGNTVSAVQINGYNNRGGTGFHDFLSATNTYSGAAKPHKYFRIDQYGSLHIVDSDYANTIWQVTNDGHTISKGYVQFGSFTTTARNALPTANGMVIYNTTANRFQGYQNGGWINLDNGSAA